MPTKLWLVAVDTDTGASFHIDEPDADVHVETTPDRARVTIHVRRAGVGGEWPPGSGEGAGAGEAAKGNGGAFPLKREGSPVQGAEGWRGTTPTGVHVYNAPDAGK